jgi:hypothetical protein
MRRLVLSVVLVHLLVLALGGPPAGAAEPAAGRTVLRPVQRGNDLALLLVSRSGTAIALDPFDLQAPLTADLALFTHSVHADRRTLPNVKAPLLLHRVESRTVGDVKVTGIGASHRGGAVDAAAPDHVIYRVEVDGFVVALFGCLGQSSLTPEQLAALGPVDVAVITADNGGFERLQLVDGAFAMMQQLRPRIVVPRSHHADDEEALPTLAKLGSLETRSELVLRREELRDGATRVVSLVP